MVVGMGKNKCPSQMEIRGTTFQLTFNTCVLDVSLVEHPY